MSYKSLVDEKDLIILNIGDCCLFNDDAFKSCTICECLYDPVEIMSNARHYPQDVCLYKDTGAYQDGFCHDELNTAECNYDGGDCCSSIVYTNVCNKCQCHDPSIKGNSYKYHLKP